MSEPDAGQRLLSDRKGPGEKRVNSQSLEGTKDPSSESCRRSVRLGQLSGGAEAVGWLPGSPKNPSRGGERQNAPIPYPAMQGPRTSMTDAVRTAVDGETGLSRGEFLWI